MIFAASHAIGVPPIKKPTPAPAALPKAMTAELSTNELNDSETPDPKDFIDAVINPLLLVFISEQVKPNNLPHSLRKEYFIFTNSLRCRGGVAYFGLVVVKMP